MTEKEIFVGFMKDLKGVCDIAPCCEKINLKEGQQWPFTGKFDCPLYDDDRCACMGTLAVHDFNAEQLYEEGVKAINEYLKPTQTKET